MRKKICIITSSYPQHSYQHSVPKEFAKLLAKKNYDVYILAMLRGKAKVEDELKVEYFPWIGSSELPLDVHNPKNPIHFIKILSAVLSGIFSTIKFLKKNKIDFCFCMWVIHSDIFGLIGKIFLGIPYSTWALGSDIWDVDKIPLGKFILKKILKNAYRLFADGLVLAHDVEKISNKKCTFIPSNTFFDTTLKKISYAKFDSAKINFIFLGRFHKHKGIDLLVKAINKLNEDERRKTLFHIFGMKGPDEVKIRKMVEDFDLESNTFINKAIPGDEVFSYITKSDFVIIPSRIESIPVVLDNAIQSNKPVIVTDVGDMGDLVRKHNVGFVTKPNSESITNAIHKAIETDKKLLESFISGRQSLKVFLSMDRSINVFIKSLES